MTTTANIDWKDVQHNASFQNVLSHYGLKPIGSGVQVKIPCPFHDDKTPSCGVNYEKNWFNCFGCKAGGHIIDFVMDMEGLDRDDDNDRKVGTRLTASFAGYTPKIRQGNAPKRKPAAKSKGKQKIQQEVTQEASEPLVNEPLDVNGLRIEFRTDHPFFESHNIDQATIETFGLGYTGIGSMKGRICIPIHNKDGDLIAFAGRYADENVPEDTPRYKLPKGFHKQLELFNLHRARELNTKYIVIVEGYWSTARLHQLDIPTVSCFGTSISDEQIALLKSLGYKYVILIFDGDDEGRAAASSATDKLASSFYVRRIDLPDGVKPDTMSEEYLQRIKR